VEAFEQEARVAAAPQGQPGEFRYDPAVVRTFAAKLPESLQADVRLGREFLQEDLEQVRIEDGDRRTPPCPICGEAIGKVNPQHFQRHALTLEEAYKSYPALGFTKKPRLIIQPSPEGIVNTLKVDCSMVAGAGFAECYTVQEHYWIDLR
jgi:hypothetical protein